MLDFHLDLKGIEKKKIDKTYRVGAFNNIDPLFN